jgi:CDP-glycerol glycerophosphotransferase
LLFYVFRIFPVKKNKIVVSSYAGQGYGDNGKYICNELLKRNEKLDIVWLTNNALDSLPFGLRGVKYRSLRAIYEQVTAKIWIDNRRKREYVRKRRNQYYIMTWHGGIGPKKVEKDAESQLPEEYIRAAKNDSSMADLFVAESRWTFNLYQRAFWYDGEILQCGVPREDILFKNDYELKKRIKTQLGVPEDVSILLYAPTFRSSIDKCIANYALKWDELLKCLEDRFCGKWVGFIRLHPNIAEYKKLFSVPSNVIDVTDYPDMQELLLIASCVITDYSSSLFEYGITERPAFIFASDYDDYIKERDLALDYSNLPFSVSTTNNELMNWIRNFDEIAYKKRVKEFYYDYCGLYPGGNASSIIADRILSIINKKIR